MRKTKLAFITLLSFLSLWYGCTKTEDGVYTPPITVYEKIPGTWKMLSMKLIDETAKSAGIKPDEIVLTDQLNFASFEITLDENAQNQPTTFTVTGECPELLPSQGYWDLDSQFPPTDGTPVKINLYSDAAKTQKTNQLSITAMPGATAEMELRLTHTSNQVAYATYLYKLFLAEEE
jgi:hypothetical protein